MIYTQFIINESWEEVLRSEDSVVLTKWAFCNTDKTLKETSDSQN